MGGAIPVGGSQCVAHPTVAGQRQALLGDRRSGDLAADTFQFLSLTGPGSHPGMQAEPIGLGHRAEAVIVVSWQYGLQGKDLFALVGADGDAVGHTGPVERLHGIGLQGIQVEVTVLHVLHQQVFFRPLLGVVNPDRNFCPSF